MGLSVSPGACKLLRDQLVEVIACVRSQAALVEAVAYVGEGPLTGAADAATESGAPQRVWRDGEEIERRELAAREKIGELRARL
ncbi:hypothetical protein CLM62_38460 [Streptomyces sp. SA15]|uniref:hypothetical protein n=1 Tax=Streptomyces sp. SA15 TaxID=934019 RepID=UPI000BAEDD68|nr:hypothetical protein [Streptomyces sp. SA15]PAZ10933.1 hypothetical protein CLM62_38460 [Streptomyces sp. SA15]